MKRITYCILLFIGLNKTYSQVNVPLQVINSAGGGGGVGNGVEIYYNVGEPVITTVSGGGITITQGFLQPDIIGKLGLTASAMVNNVSCNSKKDGNIIITPTVAGASSMSGYSFQYIWTPSSVCPDSTCRTVNDLAPGAYSVTIISIYTGTAVIPNDTVTIDSIVILDNADPCKIKIFNGVTANGDLKNDVFFIENIDQFPDNNVLIYNRWGQKMDEVKNYDNVTHFWPDPTRTAGGIPAAGTYFYIVQLNKDEKPIKGWIELTK